jgi:hypothetical protein
VSGAVTNVKEFDKIETERTHCCCILQSRFNGIYLKLNKCIVPGIGKGTSLGFPYTTPSEKKNVNSYYRLGITGFSPWYLSELFTM